MKIYKYLWLTIIGAGVLTVVGCNNNASNPAPSTNSVSSTMPNTNETMNHPMNVGTNMDTNLPAAGK